MAKLKAPLLSLGASGKLGNALVFFNWKGLNVVREYIIPANPRTTLQTTQRGYLEDAVAAVHAAQADTVHPLGNTDVRAYALWASVVQAATTWFNQAVKQWLISNVDSKYGVIYKGQYNISLAHDGARFGVYIGEQVGGAIAAAKIYLGTSKTALIKSKDCTIVSGEQVYLDAGDAFDDLTAGVKYYWQVRPDPAGFAEHARSGIYYFVAT